jgi:hypothetical protein
VEAGIDLAEGDFLRPDRLRLLCYRVRSGVLRAAGSRDMMFMFRSVFRAFAIFMTACGVTRLLSILTSWVPAYEIEGLTKGFLALISIGITMGLLLLPRILVLLTRIQL